jgi:hypothetical protein
MADMADKWRIKNVDVFYENKYIRLNINNTWRITGGLAQWRQ